MNEIRECSENLLKVLVERGILDVRKDIFFLQKDLWINLIENFIWENIPIQHHTGSENV